jgi:hypothetical protein
LPLLNDNNALRLLKLLSDTIKTDLDKKAQWKIKDARA